APARRTPGGHRSWRRPPVRPGPREPFALWTRRRAEELPRLSMQGMGAVPLAVLLHLDAVAVVLLVLGGDVVAPLADLARQRDLYSLVAPSHWCLPTSKSSRLARRPRYGRPRGWRSAGPRPWRWAG